MKFLIYSALLCTIFSLQAMFSEIGTTANCSGNEREFAVAQITAGDFEQYKDQLQEELIVQCMVGGNLNIVRHLIALGVSANCKDGNGFSALQYAEKFHPTLAQFLLANGAIHDISQTQPGDISEEVRRQASAPPMDDEDFTFIHGTTGTTTAATPTARERAQDKLKQWFFDYKKPLLGGCVFAIIGTLCWWKYTKGKKVAQKAKKKQVQM